MPGYVIFTVFPIHYLSYTSGFWEAILKIDIYILGCLKVSLQVKEVLEVVKLIQTTALLITLFIHYFIISAVREISISQATLPVVAETISDQFKSYFQFSRSELS